MKKLMITAACAAMTAGAFAGEVQVYDMTINVKTTECKKNSKAITDACDNTFTYYRTQTSYKFEGKFWGCECDVIACPVADDYGKDETDLNSYMFWGKNAAFHNVAFTWDLLQLVGKKTTNVEGVWNADFFICEDGEVAADATASLTGAGYGTAKVFGCADAENQISSMSGNLVGIYNVVDGAGVVGCPYCGEEVACAPYQFCDCVDVRESDSAAYGTWSLKFNSSLANKVAGGKYITEAYSFKKFVLAEMACIADGETPTERTSAEKTYDEAKEAYETAKVASDAADADAVAAYSVQQVAWTNIQSEDNMQKTALWIDGTNDTAKAYKELADARDELTKLTTNANYMIVTTNANVFDAATNYWKHAQEYLRKDASLTIYGGTAVATNKVADLKKTVANDYLALENAVAAVTAGQTVKTTLFAALSDVYDAAKDYFDTSLKFVYLDTDDDPLYDTVAKWTKDQLEDVYAAAQKDYDAKAAAAQKADEATEDAADTLKTAKIICDATGGSCN